MGTTFSSHKNGKMYKIQGRHCCTSSYVVYLLSCKNCGQQYVGQTSNTLHSRLTSRLSDIRKKKINDSGDTLQCTSTLGQRLGSNSDCKLISRCQLSPSQRRSLDTTPRELGSARHEYQGVDPDTNFILSVAPSM